MLEEGHAVRLLRRGEELRVGKFIGKGGEGAVFEVLMDGQRHALKWYFAETAFPQRMDSLAELLDRGCPHERFLWPIDIVTSPDSGEFGYVMPFRPDGYVGSADLVKGDVSTGLSQIAQMGFELTDSFLRIHGAGLCYRDINFGNVFLQPDDGSVLICDNDNVGIDGMAGSVLGVPWFMAPEVLLQQTLPNARTDRHSLAVMLFYLMMAGHPLDGRRADQYVPFDDDARVDLFGRRPVFVFHPTDRSNALDLSLQEVTQTLWDLHPKFLQDRFVDAFTIGLSDPDARVGESTWRKTMVRLAANVCYCGTCGSEVFADGPTTCWNCQNAVQRPPKLVVGQLDVMMNHDTVVRSYQIDQNYDRADPVAEVSQNPARPEQWGLRNLTQVPWHVEHPTGGSREVQPGRSIAIDRGVTIDFGRVVAKIEA
jgi:DNA-binding helix-hairpin-helix protein with protein kinase domain